MTENNRNHPEQQQENLNVENKDELLKPQGTPEMNNEFEITVRKLEMPVKPRGVLAE